jgi:hypothetical protein
MIVKERYSPNIMAANATFKLAGPSVGGFICTVSGTLSITDNNSNAILSSFPVTAGVFHPIPIFIGNNGGVITLSGGAAGTLLV